VDLISTALKEGPAPVIRRRAFGSDGYDDGACYVTIFAGPAAEQRARHYYDAPQTGSLGIRLSLPKEGGRAISEYDHHNHHNRPNEDDRKVHLAMISPWGLFDY